MEKEIQDKIDLLTFIIGDWSYSMGGFDKNLISDSEKELFKRTGRYVDGGLYNKIHPQVDREDIKKLEKWKKELENGEWKKV